MKPQQYSFSCFLCVLIWLCAFLGFWVGVAQAQTPVRVGSKRFTESYVLGELAKQQLKRHQREAIHRKGMGGTSILWEALRQGSIDLYPEYTGTILQAILKTDKPLSLAEIRAKIKPMGIGIVGELGFNNTYALAMRRTHAEKLGLTKISDLRNHPNLRWGMTHEFLKRKDGWGPLRARYGLSARQLRGIEHSLGYIALTSGNVDVKDAFSTDAKLGVYDLRVLKDDKMFFPLYRAVYVYRLGLDEKVVKILRALNGKIPESRMIRMNQEAEQRKNYAAGAAFFFGKAAHAKALQNTTSFWTSLWRWTKRHLILVFLSLFFAILVGVPLGIWASRPGLVSQFIMGGVGVMQTIPSLALLALLIPVPFLGISIQTAIVALFLYSLLPIVRNTAAGIQQIPSGLRESAEALGLDKRAQLFQIHLPLASPMILAGIKTSAVINVGTATLAALIGAGGLGEPIISGLNLNDHVTILQGAIPAALLALIVQFGFEGLERLLVPRGLRLRRHTQDS